MFSRSLAVLVFLLFGAPAQASQITEPSTFRGTLPCADCPGIDWHLDLWPEGRFHLRQTYQGRDFSSGDVGQWKSDEQRLTLRSGQESATYLQWIDERELRLMDRQGQAFESTLPYELQRTAAFMPVELSVSLRGDFRYHADAATFTECVSGHRFPVQMEGDYLQAERRFTVREQTLSEDSLYLVVDGRIENRSVMEGEGPPQSLVIERVVSHSDALNCDRAMATANLTDTYWKLQQLGDETYEPAAGVRQLHLLLSAANGRASGFSGCNRFTGAYEAEGEMLSIGPLATTMMACPDSQMNLERKFQTALSAVKSYRIIGQHLELFDDKGETELRFEAEYLP
ncbi:MAG: META domain-containing protein [Pseudomonadota bacterium]